MRGGGKKEKKIKNTQEEDKKQKVSWTSLSLVYSSFGGSVMNYPGTCLDTLSLTMAMECCVKKEQIFQFLVLAFLFLHLQFRYNHSLSKHKFFKTTMIGVFWFKSRLVPTNSVLYCLNYINIL